MTLARDTDSLESERLILRRITWSDLDYFAYIHADPDVARYIGAGHPRPRGETERWLGDILASYATSNLGQLAVVRKDDGAVIGRCGLSDAAIAQTYDDGAMRKGWFFSAQVPDGIPVNLLPELGYTFGRASWGQGYASEAAGCVFNYARISLPFRDIMSVIHADNRASLAVAQKFGVTFTDQVELAGRPFDRYHWPMDQTTP
jgi:[ribosomal protein S5]-alanine N-acetyltransferase